MSLLQDLQTALAPLNIPFESGVFSGKAPDKYIVAVPLIDTFDIHADNKPEVDVQEVRLSIYTKGSYTQGGTDIGLFQNKLYGSKKCDRAGIAFCRNHHNRTAIHRL